MKGSTNSLFSLVVLWGIIFIVIASFLTAHYYISQYQYFVDPENYIIRAKYYFQKGNIDKAKEEIERGIQIFKPVDEKAYLFLKDIKTKTGDIGSIEKLVMYYEIAKLIKNCHTAEVNKLDFNISVLHDDFITNLSLSKTSSLSLLSMWKLLTRNTWKCLQNGGWTEKQILTFLLYSGGVFDFTSRIGNTGVEIDEDVLILSEGSPEGSGAQIWFQGKNYAGNRRGLYVLILTPPPCKVFRADRFDIWESQNEAYKMEQFLEEVPEGHIGVFAVSDEATENMTDTLEQKLLSFGFSKKTYNQKDLVLFGYGYAFAGIGVKGAKEGMAVQNWAKYEPSKKNIPVAVVGILKGGQKK
ncbi:MAG: hypothetical protein LDL53_04725 [Candidatus Hydrogenedens sp.]|nr:hypothetical protein [Candidatus Hydrogenedens sp.]